MDVAGLSLAYPLPAIMFSRYGRADANRIARWLCDLRNSRKHRGGNDERCQPDRQSVRARTLPRPAAELAQPGTVSIWGNCTSA